MVMGSNRQPRKLECMVDSGADFNIFPTEFAYEYLGMSEKTLRKGEKFPLRGIGDIELKEPAYGHQLVLKHPYFEFKTWIFFIDQQYPPLLGRRGFMDQFKRIEFNEEGKKLVFEN